MIIRRRDFTIGLGLLGVAGWAMPQSDLGQLPKCLNSDASKRVDIDAHCHVFNGSDLQVERFLVLVAASDFSWPLRKVVELLAKPLQRSVWRRAPRAAQELERMGKFASGAALAKDSERILAGIYGDLVQETNKNYSSGFAEELNTPEGKQFLNAYAEYLDSVAAESPDAAKAIFGLRTSEFEQLRTPGGLIQQLENEKSLAGFSVSSIFTFIRGFYAYRFEHCYYLLRNFGCEHGSVQLIAPALVDYDYPLDVGDQPTPSPLVDQFKVMARIAEIFQGRILSYLPFDPWRVAYGDDKAFLAAQDYVANGAAVGFKIYPPMGFAPLGNVNLLRRPSSWPPIANFAQKLDDALTRFWDFTTKFDIPVIAHGAMSNAPFADRVGLGSPDNWSAVFSRYPKARACFGHFGGQELLDSRNQWSKRFLDLVARYPNAYGDISYFEDILAWYKFSTMRQRLHDFATLPQNAASKMVYGSDWEMLAIEAHAGLYFEKMSKALSDPKYFKSDVAPNVLGLNAQQFLGLRKGQQTRIRLESKFYRDRSIEARWTTQIS
jgi:predicted TIM-barrel fold metal-dependent hydrolase